MTPPKVQWDEWQHYVYEELQEIKVELAKLKIRIGMRATFYGLIGGAVPVIVYIAIKTLDV